MAVGAGAKLRDALACFAMSAIFGPTEKSVAVDRRLLGADNTEWPALIVNPSDCDLACHLYDYFRVASAIRARANEARSAANRIDLDALLPTWRSPIAVELSFAERTCGGLTVVEGTSVDLSLELGLDLFRMRRAVGDFRQGGFGIISFEQLRAASVSLGDMCRQGDDGRAQRTYLQNFRTGSQIKVDLIPFVGARRSRREAKRARQTASEHAMRSAAGPIRGCPS